MPNLNCSVLNCTSTSPDIVLHRFPQKDDLRKIWLRKVNDPLLLSLNKSQIIHRKVCHKHFEKKFMMPNNKISRNAYPTLFLSVKIATKIPGTSEDNSGDEIFHVGTNDEENDPTERSTELGDELDSDKIFHVGTNDEENDPTERSTELGDKLDSPTNQSNIPLAVSEDHNYTALQEVLTQSGEPTQSEKDCKKNPDLDATLPNLQTNAGGIQATALVLITVPEKEIGSKIGRALIEEDLAACVEVIAETKSMYKYQGKVREDNKVLLLAKTRSSKVTELSEYAAEHFPLAGYQIVSVPIENGNPHYLKWIADSVPPL